MLNFKDDEDLESENDEYDDDEEEYRRPDYRLAFFE